MTNIQNNKVCLESQRITQTEQDQIWQTASP